ncbi:MAG: TatD family hydrolase [Tannerella sp.]|jgi:TatD DNase family protein|nr:TatD family hydrolase [Tannerella sp.]
MTYCDIHTHQPGLHPEDIAVISVDIRNFFASHVRQDNPDNKSKTAFIEKQATEKINYYAVGVHPWYIDKIHADTANDLFAKVCEYAHFPEIVAIGETGLDKMTAKTENDFIFQQELFLLHAHLSEEVKKPLIIHCVKAWDELLRIRKSINPSMPWIIHGFRGKEKLATQLLNTGFYLSFGMYYNTGALQMAWTKRRLLIETDDKNMDIRDVYKLIAKDLHIPESKLSEEIAFFFNTTILTSGGLFT